MDSKELYYELLKSVYGRVNVMTSQTENGQMVVIYDDHRWLLNVLFYLYKLGEHYDLIYFDAHDDAAECEKKTKPQTNSLVLLWISIRGRMMAVG